MIQVVGRTINDSVSLECVPAAERKIGPCERFADHALDLEMESL